MLITNLARVKALSKSLCSLTGKYSSSAYIFRRVDFKKHFPLKQRIYQNKLTNFCSSTHTSYVKMDTDNDSAKDPYLLEFNEAYEHVRKALCRTDDKEDKALADVMNWCEKVLDYNVHGGKKSRGVSVLKAVSAIAEEQYVDNIPEKIQQACILGWCVEMLQGFYLMCDDIMDNSTMRRGKPCWYKVPDVGLTAVNDSLLLEHGIYKIVKFYFGKSEIYNAIVHLFLENSLKTVYGQCLDMLTCSSSSEKKFENFNLKRYRAIVEYKSSYYTFLLPVHLAMTIIGDFFEYEFAETKSICLELGYLFQIQDDYLDIYGDPSITGKVGTDIKEGKCTWFSAYVFEHAPESMKKVMMENYGVDNKEAVSKIMKLYEELKLEEKYHELEKSLMSEINWNINQLLNPGLRKTLRHLSERLYQRKK